MIGRDVHVRQCKEVKNKINIEIRRSTTLKQRVIRPREEEMNRFANSERRRIGPDRSTGDAGAFAFATTISTSAAAVMAGSATAGSASTAIEESSFSSNGAASELRVAVVSSAWLSLDRGDGSGAEGDWLEGPT